MPIVSLTSSKLSSMVTSETLAEVVPGFIVIESDKALKSVPESADPDIDATLKVTTFCVTEDKLKVILADSPSVISVIEADNNGALSLSTTVTGIELISVVAFFNADISTVNVLFSVSSNESSSVLI